MNVATFPPPSLKAQLLELERERGMRNRVYPGLIAKGTITQRGADYANAGLDGAIATLKKLVDAQERGEPGRKELIEALRTARRRLEDCGLSVDSLDELLAKVPA